MAEKKKESGLKQEAIGIVLMAMALYTAISLFSRGEPANWGGVVGDFLSWGLITFLGYTSYTFPFFLFILSIRFLLRRVFKLTHAAPAGFIVFIPALSALIQVITDTEGAGGSIGRTIGGPLASYLGVTGAVIVLVSAVLVSMLATTGLSLVQTVFGGFRSTIAFSGSISERLKEIIAAKAGARKARNKARKKKKEKAGGEKESEPEKGYPAIITPEIKDKDIPAAPKKAPPPAATPSSASSEDHLEITSPRGSFKLPSADLLDPAHGSGAAIDNAALLENSKILSRKLLDFGISGNVIEVRPGPIVTMYEFEPASGVKVGRIINLSNDLALAMKAPSIRIIAPIPGKSVVGIEIPNAGREKIFFRDLVEGHAFAKSRSRLSLALGKDIAGNPFVADLAKMPHLLIAGATGAGKSVAVNAMIASILLKATPEEVRLLMIDPKMLELTAYEGIPHLITPVITEPKKAAAALKSLVAEMVKRYRRMTDKGAKNIDMYNHLIKENKAEDGEHKRLPYIVVIIDELADLMMTSGKDVEESMVRLSQMARASGIHLIVATQRPSVDVVTGLIKTNFPARIAFQLPTRTDSRTILDSTGAETLLGSGDMLFLPPNTSKLHRLHGVYISEGEIKKVAEFWRGQGSPAYDETLIKESEKAAGEEDEDLSEEFLRRYDEAVELASSLEMISTSYIQRRFRIGYNTAARLIERMEHEGIVGPSQGSRPREVLKRRQG
ncbi:MAG: DNA translocase FtsK [Thermodesulfobacteriota bacterium]